MRSGDPGDPGATRELIVAEGYQNVTIRKIAESIEYSPPPSTATFRARTRSTWHWPKEGLRMLFAATCRKEDASASRIDAIRSMFWRLYEFSKSHPEYYALMFVDRSVPLIHQDWHGFGFVCEMRSNIAAFIQEAVGAGGFPPDTDPNVVFHVLMAPIQGIAIANLSQRLVPGDDADAIARDALEAALTGLRTGFRRAHHRSICCE